MHRFSTISEFHHFLQLPKPAHPLLSVIDVASVGPLPRGETISWSYDFYCIAVKSVANTASFKVLYGQHPYDFDEGVMSFVSPGQVISFSAVSVGAAAEHSAQSGWMVLIHPDFLWNTSLAKTIRTYDFWAYSVQEALFLSPKEQETITSIIRIIQQEQQAALDKFSKRIVVSHLEAFLHYADRFYQRQFLTREKAHHQLLTRLDKLLTEYFESESLLTNGLPTVQYISEALHISPAYLRGLLKLLTGQNTQQHIHEKLIDKAKEKLSTTGLSVSEIAYGLGFEHLQSFSKLFKAKTKLSPVAFRQSLN